MQRARRERVIEAEETAVAKIDLGQASGVDAGVQGIVVGAQEILPAGADRVLIELVGIIGIERLDSRLKIYVVFIVVGADADRRAAQRREIKANLLGRPVDR